MMIRVIYLLLALAGAAVFIAHGLGDITQQLDNAREARSAQVDSNQ